MIVDTKLEHLEWLAKHMRQQDKDEIGAMGKGPLEALLEAHEHSSISRSYILPDGDVSCSWGIIPRSLLCNNAWVWLLGSHRINDIKKTFLRHSISEVAEFMTIHDEIGNWVDGRYKQAHRWLKALGFKERKRSFYGEVEFIYFYKDSR